MHKNIKGIIIFIISFPSFYFLEFASSLTNINSLISPFVFALTLSISVTIPKLRKKILQLALGLLLFMINIYLFNYINEANLVGGLGFGIFVITIATYIPNLIKRGYIERF